MDEVKNVVVEKSIIVGGSHDFVEGIVIDILSDGRESW